MARKSAKPIAVLQIVLVIILAAILGLLSGMLTGHPWFTNWVNASPRYSVWILAASLTAVVLAMIAVALWQWFASRGPEPATREDLEAHARKIMESLYDAASKAGGVRKAAAGSL